jgi:pyridoxal phosphate enzyme (YggS family)
MSVADNVKRVQDNIAAACARANRDPSEVTLVAVSKRKPVADVLAALQAGVTHFGENRLEESAVKLPAVAEQLGDLPPPHWHFVGHIQSRKTKDVLSLFPIIHSLDSVKLAQKMSRIASEAGNRPAVFIQVNIAGEDQKYGFDGYNWQADPATRDELLHRVGQVLALEALEVRGLMTMAPYGAPEADLRRVFASLAALRETVNRHFALTLPDLSMGMTDDYPLAIEEGATVVRVGRALFGEREY